MRPAFWRRKQRSTRNRLCGITFESSCAFQFFNQSNTPKGAPPHHMGAWGQTSGTRRESARSIVDPRTEIPSTKGVLGKKGGLSDPAPAILIGGGVRFSFPSPVLVERCPRSLARGFAALRRRAIFVLPEGEGRSPRTPDRRGGGPS